MNRYLVADYHGPPFRLFGAGHLIALAVVAAVCLSFRALRRARDGRWKDGVRVGLALLQLASESSWQLWSLLFDRWSVRYMLPLHLCSLFAWLGAFMLLTRSYRIFELAYFLGIGGALQALLTPDLGIYGFPHFRAIQFFIGHGCVLAAPIFMAVVEGCRPTLHSLGRVVVGTNVYMAAVFVVNRLLGSDYMYISAKPESRSILDALGPWPWYVLAMEALGMAVISLLYIPYAVKDLRARGSAGGRKPWSGR